MKTRLHSWLLVLGALFVAGYAAYGWVLRCPCGSCACGPSCRCPKQWNPWVEIVLFVAIVCAAIFFASRRRCEVRQ